MPSRTTTDNDAQRTPLTAATPSPAQRGQGQGQGQGQAQTQTQGRGGAPAVSDTQREEFRAWMYQQFEQRGWARRLPNGEWQTAFKAFAQASGLPYDWVTKAVSPSRAYMPSPQHALALAKALGISPLAMQYRAGHLRLEDVAAIVGPTAGELLSRADAERDLAALRSAGLPDEVRARWEDRIHSHAERSARLQAQLALSDGEFEQMRHYLAEGGMWAREQTRRDILADATPVLPPDTAAAAAAAAAMPQPRRRGAAIAASIDAEDSTQATSDNPLPAELRAALPGVELVPPPAPALRQPLPSSGTAAPDDADDEEPPTTYRSSDASRRA